MKPPLSQDARITALKRQRMALRFEPTLHRHKYIVTTTLVQIIEAKDVGEALKKTENEKLSGKLGNLPALKNIFAYEIPL